MRGSASGRLRLHDVAVPASQVIARRRANEPDARGAVAQTWFGLCVAAVYLGIGEGARERVVRWAIDRRPGDGSTAVADIPSVRLRLGRLDAALRTARLVLIDVARRADAGSRGRIGPRAREAGGDRRRRPGNRRGAPDRRRAGLSRGAAGAGIPRCARRPDQSAAGGRGTRRLRAGARRGRARARPRRPERGMIGRVTITTEEACACRRSAS